MPKSFFGKKKRSQKRSQIDPINRLDRLDRIEQLQELRRLLAQQLLAYQEGNFEEAIALYPKLEECIRTEQSLASPKTESQKKSCLQIQAECQKIQKEIHALLQKEKEQIRKEDLSCQVDLALLKLEKQ